MNKQDSGKKIVKDSGKKRGQAHFFCNVFAPSGILVAQAYM